ncbi:hypothetical protein MUO32_28315 [Shinella sp. CPCC 101442]|uniref:hypothetical protein n=1 Tax=Shinella sp. CPCC 101442 TaxID=2932265 RepID=UPI002152BF7A|nr:hypothetical protein [Shinella sp. CPCC 101442]MCR6502934.1 hypothetical protein [Shinella sp. CPCC 101442]
MPAYTIETTYKLPIYRHRVYNADTLEEACLLAVRDADWNDERPDIEASERTFVSGIWEGALQEVAGRAVSVPPTFDEAVRRKADLFEHSLRLINAAAQTGSTNELWRKQAQALLKEAMAIGADCRSHWLDPQLETGAASAAFAAHR